MNCRLRRCPPPTGRLMTTGKYNYRGALAPNWHAFKLSPDWRADAPAIPAGDLIVPRVPSCLETPATPAAIILENRGLLLSLPPSLSLFLPPINLHSIARLINDVKAFSHPRPPLSLLSSPLRLKLFGDYESPSCDPSPLSADYPSTLRWVCYQRRVLWSLD